MNKCGGTRSTLPEDEPAPVEGIVLEPPLAPTTTPARGSVSPVKREYI